MNRRHPQSGFTLIELMVVVTLTSVMIYGIYAMSANLSEDFSFGVEINERNTNIRFAVDALSKDLEKAGLLATPNSTNDPYVCPKPANTLRAITITDSGQNPYTVAYSSMTGFNADDYLNLTPMSITLLGNFTGGRVFEAQSISGSTISLRSLVDLQPPVTAAELTYMFKPGADNSRMVRIVNEYEREMYFIVSAVDFTNLAAPTITLTTAVNPSSSGFCGLKGLGQGYLVSPVNYVRYRVLVPKPDSNPDNDVYDGTWYSGTSPLPSGSDDDLTGFFTPVLVREELMPDGTTVRDETEGGRVVIAEHVVDLQLMDFEVDGDGTGENPTLQANACNDPAVCPADLNASPEDLRFLTAQIAIRSQHESPFIAFIPRTGAAPPAMFPGDAWITFNADPTIVGAAFVDSAFIRVGFRSLAMMNLK